MGVRGRNHLKIVVKGIMMGKCGNNEVENSVRKEKDKDGCHRGARE